MRGQERAGGGFRSVLVNAAGWRGQEALRMAPARVTSPCHLPSFPVAFHNAKKPAVPYPPLVGAMRKAS